MDPSEKAVYLTFDDGPIPQATPFILETLARYNIKATFFVVGENVQKHPELFRQIVEEGHQVGNHTFHHIGSFKHWAATYLIDTFKCQQAMGHKASQLFRPPHGWMRHSIYYWMSKEFKIVMWDLVTRDYSRWLTADDVVNNVKRYARNGSIITFHDSMKSIEKLWIALPQSIEWLHSKGYEFKVFDTDIYK